MKSAFSAGCFGTLGVLFALGFVLVAFVLWIMWNSPG
jgi:hypothetical protein